MSKKPKLAAALREFVKKQQYPPNPQTQAANEIKQLSPNGSDALAKFQFVATSNSEKVCSDSKIPFSPYSRILLLGEGNFSFSVSLLEQLLSQEDISNGNENPSRLISTCLEKDQQALLEKYPEAEKHLDALNSSPISVVLFGIDATCPKTLSHLFKKYHPSRVVFNFPHLGRSIKDQDQNTLAHQKFIASIFKAILAATQHLPKINKSYQMMKMKTSCGKVYKHILQDPELKEEFLILITLKEGLPYDNWNIKKIVKESTENKISCCYSFKFDKNLYPGYAHVNTIGHYSLHVKKKISSISEYQKKGASQNKFSKDNNQKNPPKADAEELFLPDNNLENKSSKTFVFSII